MFEDSMGLEGLERLRQFKLVLPVVVLALLWLWETWAPFLDWSQGRWRHAARNLSLGLFNALVIGLAFGALTVVATDATVRNSWGLLHVLPLSFGLRFALGLLLLDAWMYLWHRANHSLPLLWRFHRVHHSDDRMDVTTAVRFHLGEHLASVALRLALIPLLGLGISQIIVYELAVIEQLVITDNVVDDCEGLLKVKRIRHRVSRPKEAIARQGIPHKRLRIRRPEFIIGPKTI